jgi:hypothetical protein
MNARPIDLPQLDVLLLTVPFRARRRGRLAIGLAMLAGLGLLAFGMIAPAFGSSGRLTLLQWAMAGDVEGVEIALPDAMPQDLVEATRGERAAILVSGEQAEAINAALPFSTVPLETARPFVLPAASSSVRERAIHCLAQAIYYEAGYEPVEGRRAVAQVVLNRVRHPAFPNSVCGVVYDGWQRRVCQFSFTCDGSLRRAPAAAAWAAAESLAREALQGGVSAGIGLATHYHANYVSPYWAPRLVKLRQVGTHIFYRWPGGWGRTAAFSSRYSGIEAVFAQEAADQEGLVLPALAISQDPTDRRAPEDVGGRLDVTKGWTLSIPSPEDSRGRLAGILDSQVSTASESQVVATADASSSVVQ